MSNEYNNLHPSLPPSHSNFSLFLIISREKLTGPKYFDWIRALRISLMYEGKEYVLNGYLALLDDDSSEEEVVAYNKHYDESIKFSCIMLATMSFELQKSRLDMNDSRT